MMRGRISSSQNSIYHWILWLSRLKNDYEDVMSLSCLTVAVTNSRSFEHKLKGMISLRMAWSALSISFTVIAHSGQNN